MAQGPRSAAVDPSGVPTSDGDDATAAERATDEGMPEAPAPAAEEATLETADGDIDGGWVGPSESDDRRGIDDDDGEHDLGGEG